MLAKRVIPCLDVKDGRVVKGVNFVGLRDAGDPIELARRYDEERADEVIFLDITATSDKRATAVELASDASRSLHLPFTVGGGFRSVADIRAMIAAGADKVSINSAAVKDPCLITVAAPSVPRPSWWLSMPSAFRGHRTAGRYTRQGGAMPRASMLSSGPKKRPSGVRERSCSHPWTATAPVRGSIVRSPVQWRGQWISRSSPVVAWDAWNTSPKVSWKGRRMPFLPPASFTSGSCPFGT